MEPRYLSELFLRPTTLRPDCPDVNSEAPKAILFIIHFHYRGEMMTMCPPPISNNRCRPGTLPRSSRVNRAKGVEGQRGSRRDFQGKPFDWLRHRRNGVLPLFGANPQMKANGQLSPKKLAPNELHNHSALVSSHARTARLRGEAAVRRDPRTSFGGPWRRRSG